MLKSLVAGVGAYFFCRRAWTHHSSPAVIRSWLWPMLRLLHSLGRSTRERQRQPGCLGYSSHRPRLAATSTTSAASDSQSQPLPRSSAATPRPPARNCSPMASFFFGAYLTFLVGKVFAPMPRSDRSPPFLAAGRWEYCSRPRNRSQRWNTCAPHIASLPASVAHPVRKPQPWESMLCRNCCFRVSTVQPGEARITSANREIFPKAPVLGYVGLITALVLAPLAACMPQTPLFPDLLRVARPARHGPDSWPAASEATL